MITQDRHVAKMGPSPELATPDAALAAARDATGGSTDGSDRAPTA